MYRIIVLVIILLMLQSHSFADTAATTLIQLLSSVSTVQADFTQTTMDDKGKLIQQTTGQMALQRPGKFRWEVKGAAAQLVVTNGIKLWIYDPALEQVTIRRLSKEAGEIPALLLSGPAHTLPNHFKVQTLAPSQSMQWFILLPKQVGSMLVSIKLAFANRQISQLVLQDHLGHITQIKFHHVKTNVSLAPALFQFKPLAANIDIINE